MSVFNVLFSLLGSVIQSRIGQLGIVALVSWFWSAHETTVKYEKIIASEKAAVEAAYREEILREQYAAREIAEAATRRAEDDLAAAKDMQDIIDGYSKTQPEPTNAKTDSCVIDSDFIRVVQQLGEASHLHPRATRRTK
jgi:replicative DNA helicase